MADLLVQRLTAALPRLERWYEEQQYQVSLRYTELVVGIMEELYRISRVAEGSGDVARIGLGLIGVIASANESRKQLRYILDKGLIVEAALEWQRLVDNAMAGVRDDRDREGDLIDLSSGDLLTEETKTVCGFGFEAHFEEY